MGRCVCPTPSTEGRIQALAADVFRSWIMLGDTLSMQRVPSSKTSAPRAVCGSGEPEFLSV